MSNDLRTRIAEVRALEREPTDRERRMAHAVKLAGEALHRHDRWCGYRSDAPGDSIINEARDAIDAVMNELLDFPASSSTSEGAP